MDRPSDQTSRAVPHFQWGPRDISFEDEVKAKRAAMGTRRSRPARRDHPGSGHQKRALSWSEGSTKTPRWTDEMEERLQEVRALAWKAQKKWSEDQEIYVQEVEKLEDMKEEYKKFVKRRKKDQKKEGSRYRSNISSRANSDDEADDDQPLKLGSILLRRVSTATSRNETENESQSDFRTRSSFSTNVSRNVSTGVSSADEDEEDEGEQSANPVGLASKVLRRVMTPLTSDSEKSQPKTKEKEKEKSKGLRGFLRRKSTSAAFDLKKQEEKKESIIA